MDNKIFFYKLPYVYGGVTQPYFKSDLARDNWFNDFTATQVNNTGVNIKISFNYEIDVKVNVDISNMSNYNFAIVIYNGKKYYANIIDSEHVNVNVSRVLLLRNPLFENTNYFQYFTDFKIKSATFNNLFYSNNGKYIPEMIFQYYSRKRELTFKSNNKNIYFVPCALIYLSKIPDVADYQTLICQGVSSNYALLIKPIDTPNLPSDYEGTHFTYTDSKTSHYSTSYSLEAIRGEIERLSPYVVNYEFIKLPFFGANNPPIYSITPCFDTVWENYEGDIGVNGLYFVGDGKPIIYDYSSNLISDQYIESIFYIFSRENTFSIKHIDYSGGGQIAYRIELKYCFSMTGSDIVVSISGFDDTILGGFTKINVFSSGGQTSYSVDSVHLFNAENRYYNALTQNAVKAKQALGITQSVSNIAAGGAELLAGVAQYGKRGGLAARRASSGSFALGAGNIIRGIASAVETDIDISEYSNERALLAHQAMESPNGNVSASNSSSVYAQYDFDILCEEKVPFENNLATYFEDAQNYGISCFITENNFDFNLHTVNNKFFVSAIALLKHPSTLTTREYSELYSYLSSGCRYEIIEE